MSNKKYSSLTDEQFLDRMIGIIERCIGRGLVITDMKALEAELLKMRSLYDFNFM
jgi:hypothetical protein